MLNLTDSEKVGLASIDLCELHAQIDRAIRCERVGTWDKIDFHACGPYVMQHLRTFESRMTDYRNSKSVEKRKRTLYAVEKAGRDLSFAVSQMKDRMERETKEGEHFYVDDIHFPPGTLTENLMVRVAFKWRRSIDEDWSYGGITVRHRYTKLRVYDGIPRPQRKPSAWKIDEDRQSDLFAVWQHLYHLTQFALQEFFRNGGDGASIPNEFQAISGYDGQLNNHSADFWRMAQGNGAI
ncbi:hypothetical protein [Neotabrizicola sp. sgz301269]|uniref:hypothetical protein n=1 Tax=Neotabrizicola sp. sgz301269 TaxID=3276282 RepID=UPI00376F8F10